MMSDYRRLRRAAAVALVLGFTLDVHAAPISKCDAAKKKCLGKYVAAVLGCHAKAEQKGVPPDLCEALWRQMIGWFIQYEEEKLRTEIEATGNETGNAKG